MNRSKNKTYPSSYLSLLDTLQPSHVPTSQPTSQPTDNPTDNPTNVRRSSCSSCIRFDSFHVHFEKLAYFRLVFLTFILWYILTVQRFPRAVLQAVLLNSQRVCLLKRYVVNVAQSVICFGRNYSFIVTSFDSLIDCFGYKANYCRANKRSNKCSFDS